MDVMLLMLGTAALAERLGISRAGYLVLGLAGTAYLAIVATLVSAFWRRSGWLF